MAETLAPDVFETLAQRTFAALEAWLERLPIDGDIELVQGVLTIELATGQQLLINKNNVHQQIWYASPLSGAWHFSWQPQVQQWHTKGQVLEELLARELSQLCGQVIVWDQH